MRQIDSGTKLEKLLEAQLRIWPDHGRYLDKSFLARSDAETKFSYVLSELIDSLVGPELHGFVRDYRWLCERFIEEELYFRRSGRYRHDSIPEVVKEVYGNPGFMTRYMRGLLISQLFWNNHFSVIHYYANTYLPSNRLHYSHLEIGPGHGLLLCFAARDPRCASAAGWDISPTSLELTRRNLSVLEIASKVRLEQRNAAEADSSQETFDSVVISEVLEHLEAPGAMLEALRPRVRPGGRLLINFPINSPAPDHIYLLRTPESVAEMVKSAGWKIHETRNFPGTGYSEEMARKKHFTISCVVVAGL